MPEAIAAFRESSSALAAFGKEYVEHHAYLKQDEWKDFSEAVQNPAEAIRSGPVTQWEFQRYFNHA
jgi:glutamine synthetase